MNPNNNSVDTNARVEPIIPMTISELMRVIGVGAGAGLVAVLVMYLMNTFVFGALLCRDQSVECANAPFYSMIVAMVFSAVIGLVGLAKLRIYRPLMAVLAATVSLWGFHVLIAGMPWYWAGLVAIVLFAIAYGLFGWVARLRSLILAVVITIILVVIVRLVIG